MRINKNPKIITSYLTDFNRYVCIILALVNKFLKFSSEKIIKINIWEKDMYIPIFHPLPLYSFLYKNYSTNLGRISSYINHKYARFTAVDVGANIGDSATLIRKYSEADIICVEGDKTYLKVLKINLANISKAKILNTFVGDKNGEVVGELDSDNGTASIDTTKSSAVTKLKTLDSIIVSKKIKLLKIDTDGFEAKVIRGAKDIVLVNKPVIFFEFDRKSYEKTGESDYKTLNNLYKSGYTMFLVYDNFGNLLSEMILKNHISKPNFQNKFNYKKVYYYDIAAFHKSDVDLFKYSLTKERKYFKKLS